MRKDMSAGANELALTTENDSRLMQKRFDEFAKNLTVKKAQGRYDRAKAVDLMMYFVESAAKQYTKDFGGEWSKVFPKADREQVAEYFRDYFERHHKEGAYDEFIPAKYLKKTAKKTAHR